MVQKFEFEELDLKGAYIIKPFIAWDNRGYLVKDYSKEVFEQNGIIHDLKEIFYTVSHKGVIRAIHFQKVKGKLVRCVKKIFSNIQTMGGFYLNDENNNELLVPEHFGHGYLVLENSIVSYKCAEKFYSEHDTGIMWNDLDLAIEWPLDKIGGLEKVINSEKDDNLQSFKEWEEKQYE